MREAGQRTYSGVPGCLKMIRWIRGIDGQEGGKTLNKAHSSISSSEFSNYLPEMIGYLDVQLRSPKSLYQVLVPGVTDLPEAQQHRAMEDIP